MVSVVALPTGISVFQRDWLSANNVLLQNDRQTVLIDSGYSTHADMTLRLLRHALGSRHLDTLVNTHLHSDHCGGNALIQLEYPDVKTYIPPGHLEAVSHWHEHELTFGVTGQICPQFKANAPLRHGNTYEWAGFHWLALAAPGHDNHAMMFYCPLHGILISGDALWEKGFGVIFPELDDCSGYQEADATLDLIASLEPALIIPGHGNIFCDVRSALNYAHSRLQNFRNHPDKHARYASKVLVKFKLQEFGSIDLASFTQWAQNVRYLARMHLQLSPDLPFSIWFEQLLADLCHSGAMDIQGQRLINIA